jgi:hypothetical protein
MDFTAVAASADGEKQSVFNPPNMIGQASGHTCTGAARHRGASREGACAVKPCSLRALAGQGRIQLEPQSLMRAAEVVKGVPPREMSFKFRGGLGDRPKTGG